MNDDRPLDPPGSGATRGVRWTDAKAVAKAVGGYAQKGRTG